MTARNFLELQTNLIRHAAAQGRAIPRSEWQQNKCVVADYLLQHQTRQNTYLVTMFNRKIGYCTDESIPSNH